MNPRIYVNTYLLGENGTYLTKIVPHEYRWCSVPCSIHLNCSTILSHAAEWQWDCDVLEKTFFTNQTLWSVLRNSILVQKLLFWEKKAITTVFSKMLKFLVFYNYIQNEWGKNKKKNKIKAKNPYLHVLPSHADFEFPIPFSSVPQLLQCVCNHFHLNVFMTKFNEIWTQKDTDYDDKHHFGLNILLSRHRPGTLFNFWGF